MAAPSTDIPNSESEEEEFLFYPELSDLELYQDIYQKKEFRKTQIDAEEYYAQGDLEAICQTSEKLLQPHQEFVRNFISTETPYNGLMLFHGVGTGKTCAAISIAEGIKEDIMHLGQKMYIIAPKATQPNFQKELYSLSLEDREREAGVEPGTFQCTGATYYIPPEKSLSPDKRRNMIQNRAFGKQSAYRFFNHPGSGLPRYIEYQLKPQEVAKQFSNTVLVVDEAHNLVSSEEVEDLEEEQKKSPGKKKDEDQAIRSGPVKNTLETLMDLLTGYHAFKANLLKDDREWKALRTERRRKLREAKLSDAQIRRQLQRQDEEHATKAWEGLSASERQKWRKYAPQNLKLVLLTATPMKNEPTELIPLLNLLRANDGRPLIMQRRMFQHLNDSSLTPAQKVNDKYLVESARGYISYVRGQNPLTFPEVLDPPEELLYNPGYVPSDISVLEPQLCTGFAPVPKGKGREKGTDVEEEDVDDEEENVDEEEGVDAEEDLVGNEENLEDIGTVPEQIPIPLYSIESQEMKRGEILPGIDRELRLVLAPMSAIQYASYLGWVQDQLSRGQEKGRSTAGILQLGLQGRQIGTVVYPTGDPTQVRIYGGLAFNQVFQRKEVSKEIGATAKGALLRQIPAPMWSYQTDLGEDGIRAFLMPEPILDGDQCYGRLGEYSPKFLQVLQNMQDPRIWKTVESPELGGAINFVYNEFRDVGAITLGLILELNGFVRYKLNPLQPVDNFMANGRYREGRYDPMISNFAQIQRYSGFKPRYRCYRCARIMQDPIHDETNAEYDHPFKQGAFTLFLAERDQERKAINEILNMPENRYGEIIKTVIGSKVSGEGINFMNVRQVHLINPWHNNTVMYQAMGRAIRHCAHKDLPAGSRNVTIYKYSATVPLVLDGAEGSGGVEGSGAVESNEVGRGISLRDRREEQDRLLRLAHQEMNARKLAQEDISVLAYPGCRNEEDFQMQTSMKQLMTETLDESTYFRILRKDILIKYVERILKQIAIDCAFFQPINVFPQERFPGEADGTRICDYLPCKYKCLWKCVDSEAEYWDPNTEYPVNLDTYNLFFSKVQVDRVIRFLQKLFRKHWSLTLSDILKLVRERDPKIEQEYVYAALDRMLQESPGRPYIQDRYDRPAYLIFRGNYYIVQPTDLVREDLPTYYRRTPLQIRPYFRNIEALRPEPESVVLASELGAEDVKEVETDPEQEQRVQRLREMYQNICQRIVQSLLSEENQSQFLMDQIRVDLEKGLDRMELSELAELYEILPDFGDIPCGQDAFRSFMEAYLKRRELMLYDENGSVIGHRIGERNMVKNQDGSWRPAKQTEIIDSEEWYQGRKMEERVLFDRTQEPDKKYRYYGYFEKDDRGFKLVDLGQEVLKMTKDPSKGISIKTRSKGKLITNYTRELLGLTMDKLAKFGEDTGLLNAEEIKVLQRKSGTKPQLGAVIENTIRLLEFRDPDNRWFLYPPEYQKTKSTDDRGREITTSRISYKGPRHLLKEVV